MRKKVLAGVTSCAVMLTCLSIYSKKASPSSMVSPVSQATPSGNNKNSGNVLLVSSAHVAVPIDSTYKLVFDDEFNGTQLDTSKWTIFSSTSLVGASFSLDNIGAPTAQEAGGFLRLYIKSASNSNRPYNASLIYTKQAFAYGYWELRARMAPGPGLFSAFWMCDNGNYPEIDVFEALGNMPNTQWLTYHPVNDIALTGGIGLSTTQTGVNYSTYFHVYGLLWTPANITWYIDGVQVFQLTQGDTWNNYPVNIAGVPMNANLYGGVGGWANNNVTQSSSFPVQFNVDYLHIYSNNPKAVAVTPEAGYGGPGDATGSGGSPL